MHGRVSWEAKFTGLICVFFLFESIIARDCVIYFPHTYFSRLLCSCMLHSLKYGCILRRRSRERVGPSFSDGEKKCRENVKYDIFVNKFLMHQNTFRNDPEDSRDLSSSRSVNSELILTSKCNFRN